MQTDAIGQSLLLTVRIAKMLKVLGIPYVINATMAVVVHGVVRASRDSDAVISTHLTVRKRARC